MSVQKGTGAMNSLRRTTPHTCATPYTYVHQGIHPALYAGLCLSTVVSTSRVAQAASDTSLLASARVVFRDPLFAAMIVGVPCIIIGLLGYETYRSFMEERAENGDALDGESSGASGTDGLSGKSDTFTFANVVISSTEVASNAAAPQNSTARNAAARKPKAKHFAKDYEQIAQNYVERQRFEQRQEAQKQGVRSILVERLGAIFSPNMMMDGLPVIERADGSVGDVGTTWWKAAVGDQMTHEGSMEADFEDPTQPQTDIPTPQKVMERRRHNEVVSRIANIDFGLYPASRTPEQLNDRRDVWEIALAALDEKISEASAHVPAVLPTAPKPVTASALRVSLDTGDVALKSDGQVATAAPVDASSLGIAPAVAAPESQATPVPTTSTQKQDDLLDDIIGFTKVSLDDPELPASHTEVMHFHVPGSQLGALDEKSYVEYLIADEMSRARHRGAHAKRYDYLHVIEGGTSANLMGSSGELRRKSHHKPRHMKPFVKQLSSSLSLLQQG